MNTPLKLNRRIALALASLVTGMAFSAQAGDHEGYRQFNLVSDQAGLARFTDANLINPWGILMGPEGHLIVADNHAAVTTFYNPGGHPVPLVVNVPTPDGRPGGAVTDLAMNHSERSFIVSKGARRQAGLLLFATEDGAISGWNPEVDAHNAVIAVDNSGAGAIYKSLTLAGTPRGPRLYAANFGQGVIEVYDGRLKQVASFTDPGLAAASFVPFGVRVIGTHLFVTYAFKASPADDDETAGPGLGYVVEFDLGGNLVRRFASQGTLNAPWGLALAPSRFGKFGGALLVGNFGDGRINAYHAQSGVFLGQLADANGTAIQIEGLWGLAFGAGPQGPSLYFTAGPNDENNGLLGVLRAEAGGGAKD
jgi:uncharacterized protein (TIGR03118 family)